LGRWPPKDPPKGPPIVPPKGIPPKIIPKLPPQVRARVRMVKGRYKIVAGDRVIELNEVPTMVINIRERRRTG